MSTLGKVLVVLVILVMPVWVVLACGIASLNADGSEAVKKLKEEVAKLEPQVPAGEAELASVKDQTAAEQDATADEQAVLRGKLASVERARSQALEIQARLQNQLEMLTAALKGSQATRDARKQELQEETKARDEFRAEVTKLQAENSALMNELASLREEFKKIFEENRKLVRSLIERARSGQRSPVSYVAPGR